MKKASLVALMSLCSAAQADLPVVIDHSSYPLNAEPIRALATPPPSSVIEANKRIEQLQAEVQQLTGKVDEQAFRIEELKKQQKTMYSDFDERLQSLENKTSGVDATGAEAAASVDAATTSAEETPVPAEVPAPAPEAAVPSATPVEAPTPASTPAETDASSPEKLAYDQAYSELRKGHTNQSIEQFNAYITNYPDSSLASNAQYWLGEAYRVNQDNDAARKAFNDVIDKYPTSAKVPDALLSLGTIELEQKNVDKAREYLTRVQTDYPKTASAQKAAKKLQKLDAVKN